MNRSRLFPGVTVMNKKELLVSYVIKRHEQDPNLQKKFYALFREYVFKNPVH